MRFILLAVVLTITTILFASPYQLSDLIDHGLEHSPDIRIEENNVRSSTSSYRSSWFGLLPSAVISASRVNSEQSEYNSENDSYESERAWRNAASLSLSKSISLNESSYYDIRSSYYTLSSSRLYFDERRQEIAYYIFSQFLSILEYQKQVVIQQTGPRTSVRTMSLITSPS